MFALLAACTDKPDDVETSQTSASLAFSAFPDPGFLCSPRRMVTQAPGGVCISVAGWTPEAVFPGAAEPELREFCLYHYTSGGDPTPADIAALPGEAKPDCLVAHPLAQPTFLTAVRRAFHAQIELPTLDKVPGRPAPATTWVAMIDTSPASPLNDGRAVSAPDLHGYTLARMVREAGCPDTPQTSCVVHVHHELALPWTFDGAIWTTSSAGGHFGYQTDVARAVNRAVDAWRASTAAHLVVNLSIGWLPKYGGAHLSPHAPTDAAYAAIAKARCLGALIFAAAGNRSGGLEHNEGPLAPALWAARPAPTAAECLRYSNTNGSAVETGWGLLEAVGGVDPADRPLANARPHSTPRLVAPSFMGAAGDIVLTGTSVGTAVTSAAAAIAWAYASSATPFEIIQALYEAGAALDAPVADIFCERPCPTVRRVSVCSTLENICERQGAPACIPQHCHRRPPYVAAFAPLTESMFDDADQVFSAATMRTQPADALPHECGAATYYRPAAAVGTADAPCPDRQSYEGSAHPNVIPQPSGNACPQCRFTQNALTMSVTMTLDANRIPGGLDDATIVVETGTTTTRFAVSEVVGLSTLDGGVTYRVNDLPLSGADSVTLVGHAANGQSVSASMAPVASP